jgi:hypothetical protein
MNTSSAGRVFVSYSQSDRACAFELVAYLEAHGIECWIAPRDIAPSAEWAAEIIDAITAARLMVLVFSASSNESPQVRREVERAVHKQLPIIAFRIDDVMPARSLEYFLSAQHWLDAFPGPHTQYHDMLCQHLTRAVPPRGLSEQPTYATPHAPATRTPQFASVAVERLEQELARYVGPIAKFLVKRAIPRASSVDELAGLLASELESETERRMFVEKATAPRHGSS